MKNDLIYLNHIRDAIDDIREFTDGGLRDKKTRAAVIREIELIGEAVNRLPESFRLANDHIPWRSIVDMRNALAHGYDMIRDELLWNVVEHDLDPLYDQISAILKETEDAR